jgi:hypothetical protein
VRVFRCFPGFQALKGDAFIAEQDAKPLVADVVDHPLSHQELRAVLAYLIIPWSAVNLADFYLVRKGHYSIAGIKSLGTRTLRIDEPDRGS